MTHVSRTVLAAVLALGTLAGAIAVGPPAAADQAALSWTTCEDAALAEGGFECARLVVPMDRRHPDAGTFSLPVVRHRASGPPESRIGALVFNPGGPGGSGVDALAAVWSSIVPEAVKARFDLVSWDPRGVGGSIPALTDCATPWPARPATGPVDWAAVVERFATALGKANAACEEANAAFIGHLGTVENVRDLDHLRAALGEDRLTYWGMSYGTRIGYAYAKTFPGRVRAIVLDGSIDPAGTTIGLVEGGAAPDQAFGVWADAYPTAAAQLAAVMSVLNRRTVPLPDGSRLTRWLVKDLLFGAIAQQSAYPDIAGIAQVLHMAVLGSGDDKARAAQVAGRIANIQRSASNTNAGAVFSVVNCLDYAGRPTVDQMTSAVRDQVRLAPAYGGSLATMFAAGCSGLGFEPDPVPLMTGDGPRVPVLILGATRDGSTIQSWTARMSRAFPMSRTVTYAGGQHVTWGMAGSSCVDDIANAYVIAQTLPPMDVGCPNVVPVAQ